MYIALCTEDNLPYNAVKFSELPSVDLRRMRQRLICPRCKAVAFYRKASGITAPCFGARHVKGCDNASLVGEAGKTGAGQGELASASPGEKIIIDLGYDASQAGARMEVDESLVGNANRRSVGNVAESKRSSHRRLRPLLLDLIGSPGAYQNSDQVIVIEGRGEFLVRDFFVPLLDVVRAHEGRFGGYWGKINYAAPGNGGLVWLNSGAPGSDNLAIYFTRDVYERLQKRYQFKDLAALSGAHVLVLGEPKATRGGINCKIGSEREIALVLPVN
ncbi:hypothetical protein ACWV27_23980 [Massilia varians]